MNVINDGIRENYFFSNEAILGGVAATILVGAAIGGGGTIAGSIAGGILGAGIGGAAGFALGLNIDVGSKIKLVGNDFLSEIITAIISLAYHIFISCLFAGVVGLIGGICGMSICGGGSVLGIVAGGGLAALGIYGTLTLLKG